MNKSMRSTRRLNPVQRVRYRLRTSQLEWLFAPVLAAFILAGLVAVIVSIYATIQLMSMFIEFLDEKVAWVPDFVATNNVFGWIVVFLALIIVIIPVIRFASSLVNTVITAAFIPLAAILERQIVGAGKVILLAVLLATLTGWFILFGNLSVAILTYGTANPELTDYFRQGNPLSGIILTFVLAGIAFPGSKSD